MRSLAKTFPIIVLVAAPGALAEDAPPPVTYYWHNWTDGKGVSHLTRCQLNKFELKSLSPPAAPEWANRQAPSNASIITVVQRWVWADAIVGFYRPRSQPGSGFFGTFVSGNHASSLLSLARAGALPTPGSSSLSGSSGLGSVLFNTAT